MDTTKLFVNLGGLSYVFAYFMLEDKSIKGKILDKLSPDDVMSDDETTAQLIFSLLVNSEEGVIRDRVIFKFIENKFEKLHRLIALHNKYY